MNKFLLELCVIFKEEYNYIILYAFQREVLVASLKRRWLEIFKLLWPSDLDKYSDLSY